MKNDNPLIHDRQFVLSMGWQSCHRGTDECGNKSSIFNVNFEANFKAFKVLLSKKTDLPCSIEGLKLVG